MTIPDTAQAPFRDDGGGSYDRPSVMSASMEAALKVLILAAMAAVLSVLVLGLFNMAGGRSTERSQRLMRWRIALQLIAIFAIMTALYFASY